MDALRAVVEPTLEIRPTLSLGQQQDAKPHLAENNRVHGDVSLISPEPVHHASMRRWFRGLAQHIRINEVLHNASVDSDSIGVK